MFIFAVLSACSSVPNQSPVLLGVSHANATSAARSIASALGRPMWDGKWHLYRNVATPLSIKNVAQGLYGINATGDKLEQEGMIAAASWVSEFGLSRAEAVRQMSADSGSLTGEVWQFATANQARSFLMATQSAAMTQLPGVIGGVILDTTGANGYGCGTPECPVSIFEFNAKTLLIRVTVGCGGSYCNGLAVTLAQSIYKTLMQDVHTLASKQTRPTA